MSDIKDTASSNYDEDFHFDDVDPSTHDYTASDSAGSGAQADSGSAKASLGGGSFFDDALGSNNKWGMQPRNSRKLIVFGLIIAVIVFFIFYHFASTWNNPFSELHHGAASHDSSTTTAMPSPAQIAREEQQSRVAAAKAQADALEAKSNALDQTINQQQQAITQLQSNMEMLQESVNTLTTSVSTLTQKFDTLDSKLTKPAVKQVSRAVSTPPPITYFVRAMVPGRAWLQASNGSTLSVAVGNEVPGHGTVSNVALGSGQVIMSDGSVFTYNIDGN